MINKNHVLDKTRELGNSIINSMEYEELLKAEESYYNDVELLDNIELLNKMLAENNPLNDEKIQALRVYIEKNDNIKRLQNAKSNYDKLFKNINNLISYMTDDKSRVSLAFNSHHKKCGSCGGCSKK